MSAKLTPSIALVTAETRLRGFLAKWGTRGAAEFRVKTARRRYREQAIAQSIALADDLADFDAYVEEDDIYQTAVRRVRSELEGLGLPVVNLAKSYLPTYYFGRTQAIVVVGPDGLVANTAKYADSLPIVGINPDPSQIDGVLLPFQVNDARRAVRRTLDKRAAMSEVTLARVSLSDGQTMLAFNDFFVGRQTHVSARYVLYSQGASEAQSSSGVIVSTGAGSTGWLSSVYNMTRAIAGGTNVPAKPLPWNTDSLRWVVREPFQSRATGTSFVCGTVDESTPFSMESLMSEGGVIFSDGIESDYLEFNSGTVAEFSIAPTRSRLVVDA
ncbi:MAG: hypothetical protein AAFU85_23095 [Planctomycetota bacterium]